MHVGWVNKIVHASGNIAKRGLGAKNNVSATIMPSLASDTIEIGTKSIKKGFTSSIKNSFLRIYDSLNNMINGEANAVSALFKTKLVKSSLPEKIEYTKAKKLEDAIVFTKNVLGIKEVKGFEKFDNPDIALHILNQINKSIVDVSNAYKGQLFMPKKLLVISESGNMLAAVEMCVTNKNFATLMINKAAYSHKAWDKIVATNSAIYASKFPINLKTNTINSGFFSMKVPQKLLELNKKFCTNPDSLSIDDKRYLSYMTTKIRETFAWYKKYTIELLKSHPKVFERYGITYDTKSLSKLSSSMQDKKAEEIISQYILKKNALIALPAPHFCPEELFYHEMGHLQDLATYKELAVKDAKFNIFKKFFPQPKRYYQDNRSLCLFNFNGARGKNFDILNYSDLNNFLFDDETQKTAAKVSSYAQCGIGEFVAETFAGLISGRRFSSDVIALYKKYNGPLLPGM